MTRLRLVFPHPQSPWAVAASWAVLPPHLVPSRFLPLPSLSTDGRPKDLFWEAGMSAPPASAALPPTPIAAPLTRFSFCSKSELPCSSHRCG